MIKGQSTLAERTFFLDRSELTGRFDPYFNYHLKNTELSSVFEEEALYKISKPFSGGTPSKSKPEYWDGDIPWVSPKDFKGLYLSDSEDHVTEIGLANSSTKLVPTNSILVVVRSGVLIHTLPVAINKVPVTINQDLKAFVVKDERVLPEYLGMYFFVFGEKLLPLITKHSTTVQSINTDQFAKLRIPIPDKRIQQNIVDLINEAILSEQKKQQETEQLLNSINSYLCNELGIVTENHFNDSSTKIYNINYSHVLGGRLDPEMILYSQSISESKYPTTALGKLLKKSPQYGANESGIVREDEYSPRYIRITDIDGSGFLKKNLGKTAATVEKKYFLEDKDILFARSGNTVGKSYIHYKHELSYECFFAGYMIRFVVDEAKLLPDYLFGYTQSETYKNWVKAIQRTAGQPNINAEEYKSLKIPLPPLGKQREIAGHVKSIRTGAIRIQEEANGILENAKLEVERMILG